MTIHQHNNRFRWIIVVILACAIHLPNALAAVPASTQDSIEDSSESNESSKRGFLVRVDLPIDGRSASQTQQAIKNILDGHLELFSSKSRPIIVLEFGMASGATGQGSSLGAAVDLARFLTSSEMARAKTVAYLPGKRNNDPESDDAGRLNGHAVLVALAANQLAIHPSVTMGAAGIDENSVDGFVKEAYRNVVSKRLTVPVPMAMSMLVKGSELYRTQTEAGPVYVDAVKLKELEAEGNAVATKTLSSSDQFAMFSGRELVEFGIVRRTTPTRFELANQLDISQDELKSELNQGKPWKAVLVELPDYIDKTTVEWITRALDPKVSSGDANLVILEFDSTSGDIDSCLKMARRIASYDSSEIRTVAFVNDEAAGPAAIIALSCFHVVFQNDAKIGGDYVPRISKDRTENMFQALTGIAESMGKDAALFQAMLEPELEVIRYRNRQTGEERLLTDKIREQLVDSEKWLPQSPQDFAEPITASTAEKLQIARQLVASPEELRSFYQLESEPESLKPTQVDRWLHRAAIFLASPFVAPWLLFLAMFFLFNEVSQPGLGVPGFLGTVCLILYFWSQHLDGNANWLEILLFLAGILFLIIELFVLPGFGLFGIGGLIMIVVSIVLASQTFVIPTTTEQFNQLPKSLFALAGAFGGIIFALVAFRAILPNLPYFKKMMLEPPSRSKDEFDENGDPESMVNWGHLVGRKGQAITNLAPSGKARISGQLIDVISEGRLIEKDADIEVIEVAGNRVVVAIAD